MNRTILALSAVLFVAGCDSDTPEQNGVTIPVPEPQANQAQPTPTASPAAEEGAALPASVIISTNEPFWSATIEGDTITLTGAGQPERTLTVTRTWTDAGGRHWRARDTQGEIGATVRDGPCQDSMSGASFPLSGTLALDGGTAEGCARPAGTPPPRPPEESAATEEGVIPTAFRGRWAPTRKACDDPTSSIEGVTIGARELRWHESVAVPTRVELVSPTRLRVTADYEGEGQQWSATQTLTLRNGGDRLAIEEQKPRIRCG